ncbi:Y-family DNA polymerase [Photobacterium leiognathi]|uniref:Y-family DNA polymerase n=1 Tax=Photobacterium leiognathi TaxID=553611 RepID=UPI002982A08A|nr:DUF4113 domain-containing protein [Photobacterium leiognathi]
MSQIALFDCTRFYASAAAIYQPELRDKPIAVTTSNKGIVIALNRAASKLGCKKFTPVFQNAHLEKHGLIFVQANFSHFGHCSTSFHSTLTDLIGPTHFYSIDEAFAEISSVNDPNAFLKSVRRDLYRLTRIPTGAAYADTCTLAKVASWAAKNINGFNGVCALTNIKNTNEILKRCPIDKVWGLGSAYQKKCLTHRVESAFAFKSLSTGSVRKIFNNKNVLITHAELNGDQILKPGAVPVIQSNLQINSTRTIEGCINTPNELRQAIMYHLSEVCKKARSQKQKVKMLTIMWNTNRFQEDVKTGKCIIPIEYPTNDILVIANISSAFINNIIPVPFVPVHRIAVSAIELTNGEHDQIDIFAPPENTKLMGALDEINAKYGKNKLRLANLGLDGQQSGERVNTTDIRNPLTCWNDIPIVHS